MVNNSSEITFKPNPSAPPLEKANFAPPDEPTGYNGSNVPIDIDTMPVASAVPIVRSEAVGGIVLDSSSGKHAKENNSRCPIRKKIVIASLAILAIVGIGAGLAIALKPRPQPIPEPNALGDDSTTVTEAEVVAAPSKQDEPVDIDTPTEVLDTPEPTCSLGADLTTCTTDASCIEFEVESCSMYCRDEYACRDTNFFDSIVACFGRRSCLRGIFQRSQVTCSKDKDSPCYGSNFYASAVTCEDGFRSCWDADFDECSCCDGPDCPYGIPQCSGPGSDLQALCSSSFLGKTCKDWGNPACFAHATIASVPEAEVVAAPSKPDEPVDIDTPTEVLDTPEPTCSLGADLTTCTTDASCTELEVESCSMYCRDEYACRDTNFFDSVVACFGRRSCLRGIFQRSQVTCSKDKDSPCYGSNFYASAVTCEDGFRSCWDADFDECSCCDGPDCPYGIPQCSGPGSDLQALCSSSFLGKTCKDWGNPACNA